MTMFACLVAKRIELLRPIIFVKTVISASVTVVSGCTINFTRDTSSLVRAMWTSGHQRRPRSVRTCTDAINILTNISNWSVLITASCVATCASVFITSKQAFCSLEFNNYVGKIQKESWWNYVLNCFPLITCTQTTGSRCLSDFGLRLRRRSILLYLISGFHYNPLLTDIYNYTVLNFDVLLSLHSNSGLTASKHNLIQIVKKIMFIDMKRNISLFKPRLNYGSVPAF